MKGGGNRGFQGSPWVRPYLTEYHFQMGSLSHGDIQGTQKEMKEFAKYWLEVSNCLLEVVVKSHYCFTSYFAFALLILLLL